MINDCCGQYWLEGSFQSFETGCETYMLDPIRQKEKLTVSIVCTSSTDLNNCTRCWSTVDGSNWYWEKDSMHGYYSLTRRMNDYRWFVSVVHSMGFVSPGPDSMLWHSRSHWEDLRPMRAMTLFLLHRYKLDGCAHPCPACTMDTRFLHLRSRRLPRPDLDEAEAWRRKRLEILTNPYSEDGRKITMNR